jgi:ubiquitin
MPKLIDIPTTVNALVSFFALGGTEAALDIVKGVLTNVSLKVADFIKLKDELFQMQDVAEQIRVFQQDPQNDDMQAQLREMLTQKLEQHPTFQQNVEVHGDVKADNGSVAGGVISGDVTINNTSK